MGSGADTRYTCKARCTSNAGLRAMAAGLVILVVFAHVTVLSPPPNGMDDIKRPLSVAFWMALNKYNWILDDRINTCFAEIPRVPYFWSEPNSTGTTSCALHEPPDGLTDKTKRTTLVQYAWAPDVQPLSLRCQAFVAELHDRAQKTRGNLFGFYNFDHIRRPHPVAALPYKAELGRYGNGEVVPLPPLPQAAGKPSVLLSLFDALSRPLYARLIAPKLRAELETFPSNQASFFFLYLPRTLSESNLSQFSQFDSLPLTSTSSPKLRSVQSVRCL